MEDDQEQEQLLGPISGLGEHGHEFGHFRNASNFSAVATPQSLQQGRSLMGASGGAFYSPETPLLFLANGPSFGNLPANVQWAPAADRGFQPVVYHHPFGHQPISIPTTRMMGLQLDQVLGEQLGLNRSDYFGTLLCRDAMVPYRLIDHFAPCTPQNSSFPSLIKSTTLETLRRLTKSCKNSID